MAGGSNVDVNSGVQEAVYGDSADVSCCYVAKKLQTEAAKLQTEAARSL